MQKISSSDLNKPKFISVVFMKEGCCGEDFLPWWTGDVCGRMSSGIPTQGLLNMLSSRLNSFHD